LQPNVFNMKVSVGYCQLAFIVIAALTSCKYMPEELIEDSTNFPTQSLKCDEDSVYFQHSILPLLSSSCAITDCHDQATHEDGIILDTYANIIETGVIEGGNLHAGDITEVITENDPDDAMPPHPYPALSSDEIKIIEDWILQGALNNSCNALLCDTIEVPFAGDIMPLVETFCEGCHSGTNGRDILLNNYEDILTIGEAGSLWGSINWNYGFEPMPQNTGKLTDCQISNV
jgi:hypothetical protein